jgi:ribosomal protein S18 acetylase RimI-like enzyme
MEICYKDYTDEYFIELSKMVLALYIEDPGGEALSIEKIEQTVKEASAHPDKLRIIMILDGEVAVGYAILNFIWSNEHGGDIVNIDEIFIKPQYRSKNIGSEFINRLITMHPHAKALKLEASPSNLKAIKFYERIGFSTAPNLHLLRLL